MRPGDDPARPTNAIDRLNVASLLDVVPADDTIVAGAGNLSYVVNGGFSRWHASDPATGASLCYGWTGPPTDPTVVPTASRGADWGQSVAVKTGVMFLGTRSGDAPWDYHTNLSSISDGASNTLLLTENYLAGASAAGTIISGGTPTNWACPHPNFVMFFGSDDVCTFGRSSTPNCSVAGDLSLAGPGQTGSGWKHANASGSFEGINYGRKLTVKGAFPFPNGGHEGGVVVAMCDGSTRFVTETIDGAVWAQLITPQGGALPNAYRQAPLEPGSGRRSRHRGLGLDFAPSTPGGRASQTLTVPSSLVEARRLPSGLNAAPRTSPVCPLRVIVSCQVAVSHTLTVRS